VLGRFTYPADADGDAHSTSYDDARKLLFAADEDICKTRTDRARCPAGATCG